MPVDNSDFLDPDSWLNGDGCDDEEESHPPKTQGAQ